MRLQTVRSFTSLCIIIVISGVTFRSVIGNDNDLRMTETEKIAMEKFKRLVWTELREPFMKSDFYLIRWLRKAQLDIPAAKQFLLDTIMWREKNNITNILSEDWSDLEHDYPMSMKGHDKMGRPLLFLNFGDWNMRIAVIRGITRRLQRYLTFSSENSIQRVFQAQQEGKPVTRFVVLVEVEGFNLHHHGCAQCISILTQWVTESRTYYPDFTNEVLLLNAPGIGVMILNVIRGASSAEMRNQIKYFDGNKNIWNKYLDQQIDKDQRTQQYGGTMAV